MTLDGALAGCVRELARGAGPLLVAADLDGTLAPIAPSPTDVRVPPATLAALARLAERTHTAIVTGRDLAAARALVPVAGVEFVASHGLEASFPSAVPPPSPGEAEGLAVLARALEMRFAGTALRVERKARSVAFHYRADPSLAGPLRAALVDLPADLRLQPGRLVLEALPAGGGKDAALAALVERFRPRALLVLGDDLTDLAMFHAARDLRAQGADVLVVAVAGGADAPAEVAATGDVVVAQGEVGALLALLAGEAPRPPPSA